MKVFGHEQETLTTDPFRQGKGDALILWIIFPFYVSLKNFQNLTQEENIDLKTSPYAYRFLGSMVLR